MKKATLLFICMTTFAMLSCSKDDASDTPTLSIEPSTALTFSATGTETFTITVVTNQTSWDAVSDQTWCKIQKEATHFIVTAPPNTSTAASPTATITITAGKAQGLTLIANQSGADAVSYPETADELEQAITQSWNFPETSGYISLEFGAEKSYTLLSKQPLMRSSQSDNIYLLSGTYTIAADLRTLTLSDFGTVVISTLSAENISLTLTPTGGEPELIYGTKQEFETPPVQTYKHIKSFISTDEDLEMIFVYDANKELQKITAGADMSVNIEYKNATTVEIVYPAGALDEQPVKTTFKLNRAGLAVSATAIEGSDSEYLYFSYNNKRQLISIKCYDRNNTLLWYKTATWSSGNMTSAYFWEKHICDNSQYEDENGNMHYIHDHNHDGVYNEQDRITTPETRTEVYRYSTHLNKAKTYYPFSFGSFYAEYLSGAVYAGILGEMNTNLPSEAQDDGAQFEYKTFEDGYPTVIDVKYYESPEDNYSITATYE